MNQNPASQQSTYTSPAPENNIKSTTPPPAYGGEQPKKKRSFASVFSAILVAIIVAGVLGVIFDGESIFAKKGTVTLETELDGGIKDVVKYSYKGDIITKMEETVSYPMPEGMSEEEAKLQLKGQYSALEALSFSTVTYNLEGDYFVVRLVFKDLEDESNVWKLSLNGLVELDSFGDLMSLKKTVKNLESQGYVKK